jgi:hypothetical protein
LQQFDQEQARRDPPNGGNPWGPVLPLPQFDLPALEVTDPDRTWPRLASLSPSVARSILPSPIPPPVSPPQAGVPPASLEFDGAVTVEVLPEISTDDILEEVPARAVLPVLPARVSRPLDLTGLLAQAQAEARRSPEYFHAEPFRPRSPTPPSIAPVAFDVVDAGFEPDELAEEENLFIPLTLPFPAARRHLAWIAATVVTVALATFGIAVAQPHSHAESVSSPSSAARTSVAVTRDAVRNTVQSVPPPAPTPVDTIPTVSVQSLPIVEEGTITLAAAASSHRLFVDGQVAKGGSAVVTCGSHVVKVGSRGTAHRLVVACGQELIVAN